MLKLSHGGKLSSVSGMRKQFLAVTHEQANHHLLGIVGAVQRFTYAYVTIELYSLITTFIRSDHCIDITMATTRA